MTNLTIKWQSPTKEKTPFGVRTVWRSSCGKYRVSRIRQSRKYVYSACARIKKLDWSSGRVRECYKWDVLSEREDRDESIEDCETHRKGEHDLHRQAP